MTSNPHDTNLEVRLTLTAGYCGIFPEPELILWLRASMTGRGKMLVVKPIEPIDTADDALRSYVAAERDYDSRRIASLVELLRSIGFPGRTLEILDTSDPETPWWATVTFQVTNDRDTGVVEFGIGPNGISGRDAPGLRQIFQELLTGVRINGPWSDLLGAKTQSHKPDAP